MSFLIFSCSSFVNVISLSEKKLCINEKLLKENHLLNNFNQIAESKDANNNRRIDSNNSLLYSDDVLSNPNMFVALKVLKSASHYREAALDEIEILNYIQSTTYSESVVEEYGHNYNNHVVNMVHNFEHHGPNGRHVCMAFELLGENLLPVIKKLSKPASKLY